MCRKTFDIDAYGESVWSRRPRVGVKFLKKRKLLRGDGDKKAWSPGRARIIRRTIAQGRPDCFR